jgi:hypothetical protein
MSQTSYSLYIPAVAYPGQLADLDQAVDRLTALAYAAAIVFGTLVVTDETNTLGFDQLCGKSPGASTDITVVGAQLGIAQAQQSLPQAPLLANPTYPQYSAIPCVRMGRVWVNAETACVDGTAPYVRYGAGGSGVNGNFAGAAGANLAQMPATQAVFRGTTTAAGYAVVEMALV